jgi:cutinase
MSTGPKLCEGLRKRYGDKFGCQGVDRAGYLADIKDNMNPKGTADGSIEAGVKEFNRAHEKCPQTRLLFTGYRYGHSQSIVSLQAY